MLKLFHVEFKVRLDQSADWLSGVFRDQKWALHVTFHFVLLLRLRSFTALRIRVLDGSISPVLINCLFQVAVALSKSPVFVTLLEQLLPEAINILVSPLKLLFDNLSYLECIL